MHLRVACGLLLSATLLGACGGTASAPSRPGNTHASAPPGASTSTASQPTAAPPPRRRTFALAVHAPQSPGPSWSVVARVGEQPVAWLEQRGGVALLRFDQAHTRLILHAGTAEPEGNGWPHGSEIGTSEAHRVVAGFNGGFKLDYGSVGFVIGRRVAVPLRAGLGSIVTYADGTTQIGSWLAGVPQRGRAVASVLQNLALMIDHGAPAASVESCPACWGATLGGGVAVARAALGIAANGDLVWAGGESLSPSALAGAMTSAGVQRAVELDINPEWVAGYLYVHHAAGPAAVPVVPGQSGIPGQLLAPYSRDFFAIVAR